MDQSLDLASIFCLYGNAIPVPSHGNNGILQIRTKRPIYQTGQGSVDLVIDLAHGPADPLKLRARIVADFILGQNTAVDFCGQQAKGIQLLKKRIQAVAFCIVIVSPSIAFGMACSLKELADSKKLAAS